MDERKDWRPSFFEYVRDYEAIQAMEGQFAVTRTRRRTRAWSWLMRPFRRI